jgi:hypothetical protein
MTDGIGELCGETKCAAYRDELECRIHELERNIKKAETDGNAWYVLLQTERDQHHELINKLTNDVKEAREFGERAAKLYNDSLVLRCAFCGLAYKEGTADTKHEELTKHIAICPEHPMRKLEAENEALKENCAYPWCPECKVECRATDEDHCCSSCGVDVVWPTSQHIENLGKVIEVLKKLKEVAPTTCEVEAVLQEVDSVLGELGIIKICEWCDRPLDNGETHGEGECFDSE